MTWRLVKKHTCWQLRDECVGGKPVPCWWVDEHGTLIRTMHSPFPPADMVAELVR